ncbi:MAG: hypothetical protein K0B14_00335 [Anaerolineaceae bacterium]|nr:hypothetical protein [Anaerolineaceae bacterium]
MFSGISKLLSTILLLLIFSIPQHNIKAQSTDLNNNIGFVVCTQNVYYGFNSGSSENELRFRYTQQNRQSVLFIDLFEENQFFTIGAYNNKGLFILLLDHPGSEVKNRLSPSEFENKYRNLLFESTRIADLNNSELSMNNWVIPNMNILIADKFGKTIIINSDEFEFEYVQNDLPYLGVTYLFPYDQFHDIPDILRQESNHSQLMTEIDKTDENFNLESGMEILMKFHPEGNTKTSVLISPSENQVFVSMDKTTGEIWKFDINGGTVETESGFDRNHKANIPKLGITSSDLIVLNFSNENLTRGIIAISIGILLIIIISILVYLPRNKIIQQEEMK